MGMFVYAYRALKMRSIFVFWKASGKHKHKPYAHTCKHTHTTHTHTHTVPVYVVNADSSRVSILKGYQNHPPAYIGITVVVRGMSIPDIPDQLACL